MRNTFGLKAAAALLLATTVGACSDSTERRADDAAAATGNAAERAGDATAEAGRDAADATRGAAATVGDAVANGGRAADAAVETMDVKMALTTDSRVDASDINVDSDHTTKTVTLRGSVATADQKTIAGEIAQKQAVGYRVQNNLTVGR